MLGQASDITGGTIYRRRIEESCASPQGFPSSCCTGVDDVVDFWQSSTMVQCEDGYFSAVISVFDCYFSEVIFVGYFSAVIFLVCCGKFFSWLDVSAWIFPGQRIRALTF